MQREQTWWSLCLETFLQGSQRWAHSEAVLCFEAVRPAVWAFFFCVLWSRFNFWITRMNLLEWLRWSRSVVYSLWFLHSSGNVCYRNSSSVMSQRGVGISPRLVATPLVRWGVHSMRPSSRSNKSSVLRGTWKVLLWAVNTGLNGLISGDVYTALFNYKALHWSLGWKNGGWNMGVF